MRLAAQAKAGFYPTPVEILSYFEKLLNRELGKEKKIYLLDPCCGDGRILRDFKLKGFATQCYGIELDTERANESRFYGRVLCGSIFDTIIRRLFYCPEVIYL